MNTLEVPTRDRFVSRVCFYLLVMLVMWATNRLLPDWQAVEQEKWEQRGVVTPLYAVPVSELSLRR